MNSETSYFSETYSSPCVDFLGCNVYFIATLLSWFSLGYSLCRLGQICCWLLGYPDENEEDHQVPQKDCLWEIAGVILTSYEALLSLTLSIGTGSFMFEIKGFFLLIFCINYPVFLIVNWVFGFFLTNCCEAQIRMKNTSLSNCCIVLINIFWRSLLYWSALQILFHPKLLMTDENKEVADNQSLFPAEESFVYPTELELQDHFNFSTNSTPSEY